MVVGWKGKIEVLDADCLRGSHVVRGGVRSRGTRGGEGREKEWVGRFRKITGFIILIVHMPWVKLSDEELRERVRLAEHVRRAVKR